jgi:hypothetical protein
MAYAGGRDLLTFGDPEPQRWGVIRRVRAEHGGRGRLPLDGRTEGGR